MDQGILIQIAYLIASVLFIIGIKMLGKTATARQGNLYSAVAMFIAIAVTLLDQQVLSYTEIFVTILVGSAIGVYVARKVEMTQMPEMVAIFNGFGGGASVLVATSEYWRMAHDAALLMP
jgi:NAD(P) transhydrogenase subunit beta